MDSVCEETGPRGPSEVCRSDIMCSASTNLQKEVAVCPTITTVQNQGPSVSEMTEKDPKPIQDERTAASAPKPGKNDYFLNNQYNTGTF